MEGGMEYGQCGCRLEGKRGEWWIMKGGGVDREEVGRAGWTLLHSIADAYSERPTERDRHDMSQFVQLFAKFYPCGACAEDFQAHVKESPPDTRSRTALSLWMCRAHNEVNEKLGKPTFPCTAKDVQSRWGAEPCEACESHTDSLDNFLRTSGAAAALATNQFAVDATKGSHPKHTTEIQ